MPSATSATTNARNRRPSLTRSGRAAARNQVAAKTKQATAEGTVQVIDLDRDRYASWMEHLAEERGEEFDPASIGEGPYQIVQIQGAGAEIDL